MTWRIVVIGVGVIILVGVAAGFFLHDSPRAALRGNKEAAQTCPDPLVLQPPVDVQKATSILYPGQVRGGDFKRHGGFRFDNATSNAVEVRAPIDSVLSAASRYIEMGEVQYLLDFETACGVRYRFDHLLTLAPKIAEALADLPEPKADDSRTTTISEEVRVATGETIATAVGVRGNVFVDFGVYDATGLAPFANPIDKPLCWLDMLPATEAAHVKSLPATDSQSGKQSEYCR